jgi:hypothetical protein
MYCPLCKAEYRTGFDRCSDCLVGLVPTREQAEATNVVLLWKGVSQSKFNDIVAALRDANVPNLAKSGVSAEIKRPWWQYIPIVSHSYTRFKEIHQAISWEVSVLQSDYAKAQGVVANQIFP